MTPSHDKIVAILAQFIPPPRSQRENYNLDRVRVLMEYLDNPQDKLRVIHVAGTSGKTSTCYFISSILSSIGLRVGLTVSPHVVSVSERLQINNHALSDDEFCRLLEEFVGLVRQGGHSPTYFELLMALAYWYFYGQKVDVVVVETGLGGLLDASNVVSRADKYCAITDIGLDHTEVLGDTLAKIAEQKAGIIQNGNRVFMYGQTEEVQTIFNQTVKRKNAHLTTLTGVVEGDEDLVLFQQRNWQLAKAAALDWLSTNNFRQPTDAELKDAQHIHIAARMEIFHIKGKIIVLDGAHNPQKLETFVASFKAKYGGKSTALLYASIKSGDQRLAGNISAINQLRAQRTVVTHFISQQDIKKEAEEPELIAEQLKSAGFSAVTYEPDYLTALDEILQGKEEVVVITGSLYLIFAIRPALLNLQKQG